MEKKYPTFQDMEDNMSLGEELQAAIDQIDQDLVGKSPAIASVVHCSGDALSWAVLSLQLPRALMLLIIPSWVLFIPGVYIWSHLLLPGSPPHSEHKFACSK